MSSQVAVAVRRLGGRRLGRPHRAAFPAALYLVFSGADLIFSLIAFSFGIAEGNPFMAWLLERGMFVQGKVVLSLLVAALMMIVYGHQGRWRGVVWGGVAVMGAVVALHLWALPLLILGGPALVAVP